MFDFMGKMQEAQKQMEETKKQLSNIYVDAEAEGGLVKVTSDCNLKITNIEISDVITSYSIHYTKLYDLLSKQIAQSAQIRQHSLCYFRHFNFLCGLSFFECFINCHNHKIFQFRLIIPF